MSALREAAQQALEALEGVDGPITALLGGILGSPDADAPGAKVRAAITALRAALAQEQAEPWTPAALGPSLKLWFDPANPWASVQAEAEPAQQVMQDAVTTGVGIIRGKERIDPDSIYKQAALAQEQTEPLNLSDRAIQRRLAAQWGYVPAEQAEPAQEPVETQALIEECRSALAEELAAWDIDPPLHHVQQAHDKCVAWLTAPPRRTMVPLTDEEIMDAFHAARNAKLGASQDNSKHRLSVVEIARLVEKASWEKNHGQA